MKAAVFQGPPGSWPAKPLVVQEVPRPEPAPGEVLVRVAACGMCRTDLEYMKEGMRPPKAPPLVLGHEISGTVEKLGDGVEGVKEGEAVIVAFSLPCGRCAFCRGGTENLCERLEVVGASRDGGMAEYVAVPASAAIPLPPRAPLVESAVLTDSFGTSYHALVHLGAIQPGDVVAIYGASGGLGLSAVQIAKALGATVIAVGRQPWKLAKAKEMGADYLLSTLEHPQLEKEIRRLTGEGATLSLDASGAPEMIACACRSTRPGGKIVVMGYGVKTVSVPLHRLMWLQYSILGARTYRLVDLKRVLAMAEKGMINPAAVASHRFPLAEVNEAYRMLDEGKVLRGLVVP
ncbi:MAG: zinc-binding dehydrogenase [Chloroflexi bacterium]|nr:zinc-binding dehydrogenase [Chloroflexota bacterium]